MKSRRCLALSSVVAARLLVAGGAEAAATATRPTWTNANKQGVGTATTLESKVWFTLGSGVLTEVYYPTVDQANLRQLELLVTDGHGFFERESADTAQAVTVPDAHVLAFSQANTSRSGRYRITRTTLSDPARPVVRLLVHFEPLGERPAPLRLFVALDPSLANSGLGDTGFVADGALVSQQGALAMALACSRGFARSWSGVAGESDGLADLKAGRPLAGGAARVTGDVVQLGEIRLSGGGAQEFELALGFGAEARAAAAAARASLRQPFERVHDAYAAGWRRYLSSLRTARPPNAEQFAMAAMLLKAHEDKTHRGAMIASLSIPWGNDVDASQGDVGGYHLVWSRDLYHVATAQLAIGDHASAGRALDYLFGTQQRPDGSFPQNSWLDGRPFWPSVQLDEVAYPLILAHELGRFDAETYRRHVRPAAEYLLAHGPATPQERWEEEAGYSPSTLAAEIAGLVAASDLAARNGQRADAERYRATADLWADGVDAWTVTRTGPLSPRPYFLRIAQDGRPDSGKLLEINNGGGLRDERSVVDAGFLELVRLGIRPPDDPVVVASLAVVDERLRVETPRGPSFYRYNGDGYGEKPDGRGWDGTGVGRLWPLLTGERGEYELLAGRDARPYLDALRAFANDGRMLPEQVWDRRESPRPWLRFGAGTGAATPLAWSCAEFIRLALAIETGKSVGQPEIVRRYFAERRTGTR